jgi:hypothetical protein
MPQAIRRQCPPELASLIGNLESSCYTKIFFAKLQKATISFVMFVRLSLVPSVCQSVRMQQLGLNWTYFYEIWHLRIFRKLVEKIQVPSKSDKNNGYFTRRCKCITISQWILFRTGNVSDKFVEKVKKLILFPITLFSFSKIAPFVR